MSKICHLVLLFYVINTVQKFRSEAPKVFTVRVAFNSSGVSEDLLFGDELVEGSRCFLLVINILSSRCGEAIFKRLVASSTLCTPDLEACYVSFTESTTFVRKRQLR